MNHEDPTRVGKYIVSHDEEHWTNGEEFDTREEAEAYGRFCLSQEDNWEDGDTFYTGVIDRIEPLELASSIDGDYVVEQMDDLLYEQVGDEVAQELRATPEQVADLEAQLRAVAAQWLVVNDLAPRVYRVEKVKDHTWVRCSDRQEEEQCVLSEGHLETEDHEYV